MKVIVVGTDGSPGAEAAIQKVIELAKGTGATVHLVCAYPGRSTLERLGMTAKTDPVDLRGVASDVVARDVHRFDGTDFSVERHVGEGDAATLLLDVAEEEHADLIVDRRGRRPGAPARDDRQRGQQARPPRADEPADRPSVLNAEHGLAADPARQQRVARGGEGAPRPLELDLRVEPAAGEERQQALEVARRVPGELVRQVERVDPRA